MWGACFEGEGAAVRAAASCSAGTKLKVFIDALIAEASSTFDAFHWLFKHIETESTVKIVSYFSLNILCNLLLHDGVSAL